MLNSVKISLNARLDSDLNWQDAHHVAEEGIARGCQLFWNLDLGLFHQLHAPLSDQTQFRSLSLSLTHFRDTLWKEFSSQTAGLCLYNGALDFTQQWVWDAEQELQLIEWAKHYLDDVKEIKNAKNLRLFCCEMALNYINMLSRQLPDSLIPYVEFDCNSITDQWELARLTSREQLDRLQCRLIGLQRVQESSSIGICLPLIAACHSHVDHLFQNALLQLEKRQLSFRIISESELTSQWEGLDYLVVAAESVSVQGLRKLRGFCAAGGSVLTLDKPLGLPLELQFHDWLK